MLNESNLKKDLKSDLKQKTIRINDLADQIVKEAMLQNEGNKNPKANQYETSRFPFSPRPSC